MQKAIVIGAGIGGLVTAALLAKRGVAVKVFERAPIAGGRSHILQKDGFTMSYGAHALLAPKSAPVSTIYRELGLSVKWNKPNLLKFKLMREQNIVPGLFSPGALTTPAVDGFTSSLSFFRIFLSLHGKKPNFEPSYTVEQWLRDQNIEPSVERALRGYFTLSVYDLSLERFSMNAFVEHMKMMYTKTVSLVYVSYEQLLMQLETIIRSYGGEIAYGQEVWEILVENGKAIGVKLKDSAETADRLVANLPVSQLAKLCAPSSALEQEIGHYLEQQGSYVFVYDIMLSKPLRTDIANLLDLDSHVYVNVFSLNEPTSAPQGNTLLNCLKLLSAEEQKDDSHAERSEAAVEKVLDVAYPDWRNHAIGVRKIRRALVNGIARYTTNQYLPFHSKSVEGLYFVGDSTAGRGCLGTIAYDSAWQVANRIASEPR
jgi:phytoene dehydrogenase-like protein